jgi:hypothetical protein
MSKMKSVVSSQDIISSVLKLASQNSIILGEFKEIMNNMIESNNTELMLFENVKSILYNDVKSLHKWKIQKKVSVCIVRIWS